MGLDKMKNTLVLLFTLSLLSIGVKGQDVILEEDWYNVPLKREITHPQPMTGVVFWPWRASKVHSTYGQCIQLEFNYFEPCKMVKGCNEDGTIIYDWSSFDKTLRDVANRGHQLIARFFYIYPGDPNEEPAPTTVPQYIKDLPDYQETFVQSAGTYYPDWSHSELERFTMQFFTDFAARYAHDRRLAFLEIGFGHWAEYHIYPTPVKYGKNFPSMDFQKKFLLHIDEVIGDLPWLVSKGAADDSPIPNDEELMALRFGLFEDSFMGDYFVNGGYEKRWNSLSKGVRWHTSVFGGEIGPGEYERLNFLNPEGLFGHTFEELATKYNFTFAISNAVTDSPHGTPERVKKASMSIGYRFVVEECISNGVKTKPRVTNKGIAPIYRDAYFAIGGVRSETSLRGLLPHAEMWVEIDAKPLFDGQDIHIVCDHILPQQEIEFEARLNPIDAIKPLFNDKSSDKRIYAPSGLLLDKPQKGINIIDGHKVIIK